MSDKSIIAGLATDVASEFSPTPHLFSVDDARRLARRRVPRIMFDFVDGAAGNEFGAARNRSALDRILLQPRVLQNVAERQLSTSVFGRKFGVPFAFAPMGMCNVTWPNADRILADEAVRRDCPVCVSTAASTSMEDMSEASGGRAWFQLYAGQSDDTTFAFVDRAAAAGYEVLVLTVDVPQVSRRVRDLRNGFQVPFRYGPKQLIDFASCPRWSIGQLLAGIPRPMNYATSLDGAAFVRGESRAMADFEFLDRLRAHWGGTLVVKGVMSAEDAICVKAAGADAIYVSNHGGRQLDSAPAAIDLLPSIRNAVGKGYPVLFDSGVRSGEDIVKALACGADLVMLGRPLMYALGADGARGLRTVLDILSEEVSVTMAQLGVTSIRSLDERVLYYPNYEDTDQISS